MARPNPLSRQVVNLDAPPRCRLCRGDTRGQTITLRDGNTSKINICDDCEFHFIADDSSQRLVNDQLDQFRLAKAGLPIPAVSEDFANGLRQSKVYIDEFMSAGDQSSNVLEVGCSWGYFLKSVWEFGANPVGVELNRTRAAYVRNHLKLPCYEKLVEVERNGFLFDKIFVFYALEYFPQPIETIKRLYELLTPGGWLIMLTPNLHDVLKETWRNQGYRDFFYDACAVGYYSPVALEKLVTDVQPDPQRSEITTRQGYSFVNHAHWFLNEHPVTTGMVGGDRFMDQMADQLKAAGCLGEQLATLLRQFDQDYRALITKEHCGNQILVKMQK